jgi:hypothetical protein
MTSPDPDPLAEVAWPDPVEPSPEVSAAIRKRCTQNLKPKRGLSARARWAISLLLPGALIGTVAWSMGAFQRADHAFAAALLGAAGWAVVQAAVLLVGLGSPPGKRVSLRVRLLVAASVPVLFLVYLWLISSSQLPLHEFVQDHARAALACGVHSLLCGALAAAGILALWRATDPFTPGLSGALAGLTGGVAGAVAIGLACPADETWHLWLGHGLAVPVLGIMGWLAGRRWLTP